MSAPPLSEGPAIMRPPAEKPKVYADWPFDVKEAKRRQKETAEARGVPFEKSIDLGAGVKLELVLIPAGEFMMGGNESPEEVAKKSGFDCLKDWCKNEHPQHKVRITKPFCMGRYEVTQEQWQRVMGNNPSNFKGARNPVEQVSWDNCQEFVKKLNGLGKEKGTFALPTEAEWEYACRAGTGTPFHTGETLSTDEANYNGNSTYGNGRKGEYCEKTTPAGSLKPNAFGLYDMHGNVWEWCADRYGEKYYEDSPEGDPRGPRTGESRVLRGGSWYYPPTNCRSAYRYYLMSGNRLNNHGFRVVCAAGVD